MPPLERTKSADRAARLRGTLFLGALVAALVPSAVDCGGGDDNNDVTGGSGFNCVDAFGARCGAACVSDTSCGTGLFCSNGVCTAQCTATSGCEAGRVCSTQGRCVPISTGGSGGASGAGGSGLPGTGGTGGTGGASGTGGAAGGGNCPDVSVTFRPIIPTVMILADRSASMVCPITSLAEVVGQCQGEANPTSPGSRWQSFKGPLLDLVEEVQSQVIFGSAFYPADDACSIDGIVLPVGLKLDNFDAIKTGYDDKTPGGDTPTSLAVDEAVRFINAATDLPENSPKFLILASDGSPNCTLEESQAATVAALGSAFDGGIKTFVIAIGGIFETNSIKKAQFQALADAGAGVGKLGGAAEGKLYPISNRDALTAALKTIITGVRPCSFDLDVALTDPAVDGPKGVVTLDGTPVPYNDPNGWKLTDSNTIEFVGTACDSIKGGSNDVKATFPCEVETTPVPPPPPPPR